MQTAISNPIALPNVQGAFATQVSIAGELNCRPFFRRRLMLKDGRVDFFEIVQLCRYLNSLPVRSAEQEAQLKIVMWLQEYRHSLAPGSAGDLMMGQICNDQTLPMLFVPTPKLGVQSSILDKIWNEAKATLPKKRIVPIIFEEACPQPDALPQAHTLPQPQARTQPKQQARALPQPQARALPQSQARALPQPQARTQPKQQAQAQPHPQAPVAGPAPSPSPAPASSPAQPHTPIKPAVRRQVFPQSTSETQSEQTPLQKHLKQIAARPQSSQTAKVENSEAKSGNLPAPVVVPRAIPSLKDIGEEIPRAVSVKAKDESGVKNTTQVDQLQPPARTIQEQVPGGERKNELMLKARESLLARGVANITPSLVFAEMMRLSKNS